MYSGGVTFKGDQERAAAVVPEAIRLANTVRFMKEAAGLARLEKVYDIEDGTIRVVDNDYVRHIYITIGTPEEVEEVEEEEEEEDVFEELYLLYPSYKTTWTGSDNEEAEVIGVIKRDGSITLNAYGYDYAVDNFNYVSNPSSLTRRATGEVFWEDSEGRRLSSYTAMPKSKYSISWGDMASLNSILQKGTGLKSLVTGYAFYGYGVIGGTKLIWLEAEATVTPTYEPNPIAAGFLGGEVTVKARDVEIVAGRYEFTGSTETVGTFTQERTDYGVVEDSGWPFFSYLNENNAYFPSDPSYDPFRAYGGLVGTLWFSFSQDGTKAVRCRYFPTNKNSAFHDGCTHAAFKEELTFSLNTTTNLVQFTRSITAAASGGAVTFRDFSPITSGNNTDDRSPKSDSIPPNDFQLDEDKLTNATWTDTFTDNSYKTFSVDEGPLTVAYDYTADNELIELQVKFSGSGQSETTINNFWQETESFGYGEFEFPVPPSGTTFTSAIAGSGSTSLRYELKTNTPFTATLIYIKGGLETEIPYYSYECDMDRRYSSTESSNGSFDWGYENGPGNENSGGGGSYSKLETNTTGLSTSTSSNDATIAMASNGCVGMDLQQGIFIFSKLAVEATEKVNGQGNTIIVNDASLSRSYDPTTRAPSSTPEPAGGMIDEVIYTATFTRQDSVWLAQGETIATVELPPVTGTNSQPLYEYEMGQVEAFFGDPDGDTPIVGTDPFECLKLAGCSWYGTYNSNYFNPFPPAITNPEKPALWAYALVRGTGGTVAVNTDDPTRFVFTVLGNDLTDLTDNTEAAFPESTPLEQFYNFDQQGIYYSDAEGVYNLYPLLEIVGELFGWDDISTELSPNSVNSEGMGLVGFVKYLEQREV